MKKALVSVVFVVILAAFATATEVPDQDWGYVQVRTNANMFWWLYGMADPVKRASAPLVVWLQGGPGASSTGYGNFLEIGPEDVNQKPRAINWVQSANVLFIDNPVGTGYSYVTNDSAYATTDKQIGVDLVALLKGFLARYPHLQHNPFWIFCESYGGKMTTSFGVALAQAIANGDISVNFKGVALGDSWISPIDFVMTWADYLLATSEIDNNGYTQIQAAANATNAAVQAKRWVDATNEWGNTENVVEAVSDNVNFYNILDRSSSDMAFSASRFNSTVEFLAHRHLTRYARALDPEDQLDALMNGPIKKKLGIPASVTWGGQSNNVFTNLQGAFMQDIIAGVDYLLAKGYSVNVYSGNLDLICCTPGTVAWVNKLSWPGLSQWQSSQRKPFTAPGSSVTVGFSKKYQNFNFINVLAAGHMVPADQPAAAKAMLDSIIGSN